MDDPSSTMPSSLDELVQRYLEYLEGASERPSLDDLDVSERQRAEAILATIDVAWGSDVEIPDFDSDPVVKSLGFAASPVLISGPKLKKIRMNRNLNLRQLEQKMRVAGIALSIKELSKLESHNASELSPSIATVLTKQLGVPLTEILGDQDPFVEFLYSSEFDRVVDDWAKRHHRQTDDIATSARRMVLSGQRRSSGRASPEGWMSLVKAALESME